MRRVVLSLLVAASVALPTSLALYLHTTSDEKKPNDFAAKGAVLVDNQGDPLPPGAVARFGTVRLRRDDTVEALAFLADGKILAGGSHSSSIRLWDVATGKEVRELKGHEAN